MRKAPSEGEEAERKRDMNKEKMVNSRHTRVVALKIREGIDFVMDHGARTIEAVIPTFQGNMLAEEAQQALINWLGKYQAENVSLELEERYFQHLAKGIFVDD